MARQVLIAGGGIGGLASALSCVRAGWQVRVFEQAGAFSEAGAGIQMGPNTTRILARWGLNGAVRAAAAFPQQLRVRSASDNSILGKLRLGASFEHRYGAPYATIHRADLQGLLLDCVRRDGAGLHLSSQVRAVVPSAGAVRLQLAGERHAEGDALIGADGLWSSVRGQVCRDGAPAFTGHVAYRGLAAQRDLPERLRSNDVTVWLGPRMHVVAYPVRAGEQLNVVALIESRSHAGAQGWDYDAAAGELQALTGPGAALQELLQAIPSWRLWALHDREPMKSPNEMAAGRVALVGDSAHPMLPYFAQGAGMAIEDADALGRVLSPVPGATVDVPLALRRYADSRWLRAARVQVLSRRNGRIFHATGLKRWGRDWSMRLLGERLLDQPWLYR